MIDLRGRLQSAFADRYVLERELGQGGMATVCLADDVRHDRRSAPRTCVAPGWTALLKRAVDAANR